MTTYYGPYAYADLDPLARALRDVRDLAEIDYTRGLYLDGEPHNRETVRIAERKSKRAAQSYLEFCQDNATPGYVYSLVREGGAFVVLATLIQV